MTSTFHSSRLVTWLSCLSVILPSHHAAVVQDGGRLGCCFAVVVDVLWEMHTRSKCGALSLKSYRSSRFLVFGPIEHVHQQLEGSLVIKWIVSISNCWWWWFCSLFVTRYVDTAVVHSGSHSSSERYRNEKFRRSLSQNYDWEVDGDVFFCSRLVIIMV